MGRSRNPIEIFVKLCDIAIPALLQDRQDELKDYPFLSKGTLPIYYRVLSFVSTLLSLLAFTFLFIYLFIPNRFLWSNCHSLLEIGLIGKILIVHSRFLPNVSHASIL